MKKSMYIQFCAEVERYEEQLEILDDNNPIEQEEIGLIHHKLNLLLSVIRDSEKSEKQRERVERLAKFKLLQGGAK